MNLSKELKKKRDAERRLDNISQTPAYVGTGGTPSTGGGSITGDTFITNETIINQITQVIQNQLIAGDNITITDNGNGTYTIAGDGGGGGAFAFEIGTDGHLYLLYDDGSSTPNYTVDGSGHLILDLGAVV